MLRLTTPTSYYTHRLVYHSLGLVAWLSGTRSRTSDAIYARLECQLSVDVPLGISVALNILDLDGRSMALLTPGVAST